MTKDANVIIKPSTDAGVLSQMYKELAEDEKSDSLLTDEQYAQCMMGFLKSENKAYFFIVDEKTVGYALVITDRKPFYLRHFYICRDERRKGYGRAAFYELIRLLKTDAIDLDVFIWNERGIGFWTSLGFQPRAHKMRFVSSDQSP